MPEDSKESKAQKLAAARKKLKEFQTKDRHLESWSTSEQRNFASGTTSATMSEKSDSELNLNEQCSERGADIPPVETTETIGAVQDAKAFLSTPVNVADSTAPPCTAYGTAASTEADPRQEETVVASDTFRTCSVPPKETQQTVNTLQLLICEKTQLNTELNKYRTLCREKDLENEELHTQLMATTRRLEELQQRYLEQQNAMEELHSSAASRKQQLTQSEAKISDQVAHINELQQQLTKIQTQNHELEELYKQKSNELEMAQIRINQLSDESCITNDSRVESLTQTQFMYEQQIRDLQAMVQQLTQDKEQANLQYQNYAQHLNAEVSNLNEKNSEISDECARLRDREQQLVQHISNLEREIQRNILRHDQIKEDSSVPTEKEIKLEQEIAEFKEKVSNFEISHHEFQLKIKSQEDHLDAYTKELQQKQQEIALLQEHLQNVTSEQPDKTKLLATMESDKIAASRAVTQNVELKKQLNELEQRFVQLTNDKADLMNKLDAEEHANREMRATYLQMEEKLHSIDERFKFKDEEMIRLSHENMDLTRTNLMLRQQLDRLKRYEIRKYSERYAKDNKVDPEFHNSDIHDHNDQDHQQYDEHNGHKGDHGNEKNHVNNRTHNHEHDHGTHSHDHNNKNQGDNHDHQDDNNDHQDKNNDHHDCNHEHEIDYVSDHKHSDNHEHFHVSNRTSQSESESASCHEAGEDLHFDQCDHICSQHDPHILPMTQAVEKLQQRFTQLMSQVADLTDEKQRLEHLVLQLQGETETIGEYIALYQNQRRVLKQREYEKAAQMQLLQTEREQLREKIAILNNLVSSLGAELPNNALLAEHFSNATTAQAQSVCIEPILESEQHSSSVQQLEMPANKLDSNESQKILTKIQSIISEIKENTKEVPTVTHTVDNFNCCLGKFEVV